MKIIVEIDAHTARRMEEEAPASRRRRSEFVREAIRRTLDALEEKRTEEAYRRQPQEYVEYLDAKTWDRWEPRRSRRTKVRRKR